MLFRIIQGEALSASENVDRNEKHEATGRQRSRQIRNSVISVLNFVIKQVKQALRRIKHKLSNP
jgi:hypothetical protein